MSAKIINGTQIANECNELTKQHLAQLQQQYNLIPTLAVILVGEDPASQIYVNRKIAKCKELGINSEPYILPNIVGEDELLSIINDINQNSQIHGLLIQLPLPKSINTQLIIDAINPQKDVDGFTITNIGKLVLNQECLVPCTPLGCLTLLKSIDLQFAGKKAIIIGRSNIVGRPLMQLLIHENMTVTLAHSFTSNLAQEIAQADIVISAIGKPKFITQQMIKPGAIVLDVGITRYNDKLSGDVDFDQVKEIAGYITPVPGGVGPMTIAMLMRNTLKACLMQNNLLVK